MLMTLQVPRVAPGLNSSNGLIQRGRWGNAEDKELWVAEIAAAMASRRACHQAQVRITYTRTTNSGQMFDWDNALASFKHLGDALVKTGAIVDDKPEIVIHFQGRQVKVPKAVGGSTSIEIEDLLRESEVCHGKGSRKLSIVRWVGTDTSCVFYAGYRNGKIAVTGDRDLEFVASQLKMPAHVLGDFR